MVGAGIGVGFGAGFGVGEAFSGVNPSHDRVSGLTCMPYLTPAWLALVQLKNFSPGFGLKLAQLPQISLLISFHLLLNKIKKVSSSTIWSFRLHIVSGQQQGELGKECYQRLNHRG